MKFGQANTDKLHTLCMESNQKKVKQILNCEDTATHRCFFFFFNSTYQTCSCNYRYEAWAAVTHGLKTPASCDVSEQCFEGECLLWTRWEQKDTSSLQLWREIPVVLTCHLSEASSTPSYVFCCCVESCSITVKQTMRVYHKGKYIHI